MRPPSVRKDAGVSESDTWSRGARLRSFAGRLHEGVRPRLQSRLPSLHDPSRIVRQSADRRNMESRATATPRRCIAPDIYSHVMPVAQEEAAEKTDAGLRKALAG